MRVKQIISPIGAKVLLVVSDAQLSMNLECLTPYRSTVEATYPLQAHHMLLPTGAGALFRASGLPA
jgi:hypothetical protein